jgi:hypothetical protein
MMHLNIRVVSHSTDDTPKHHLVSYGTISVTRTTHEQLQVSYDRASYGKVLTPEQLLSSYGTVPVPIHPNSQLWHSSCTDTSEQPVMAQFLYPYIRTASYCTVPVPIHPNSQLWHSSCTDTSEQPVVAQFLYWYIRTASYGTVPAPIQHLSSKLWHSSCTNATSGMASYVLCDSEALEELILKSSRHDGPGI